MSDARRPWRRCSSCGGVAHWAATAWVCDSCEDEWDEDHDPKYAPPGDRPKKRRSTTMDHRTPREIAESFAARAKGHADLAEEDANAVAAAYSNAKLAERPRLLALSQAADLAAILARQAAATAMGLAHLPGADWQPGAERSVAGFASDAHRYHRDAANARTAATI